MLRRQIMERRVSTIKLGNRIRDARKKANITQSTLSTRTGISITQLSAYENGKRGISLDSLASIAKATNTTIDELYWGNKETRMITSAINKAELIVNCITALFDEKIILAYSRYTRIDSFDRELIDDIEFANYKAIITDLLLKLQDLDEHKEDYSNFEDFRSQLLSAAVARIQKEDRNTNS